MSGKSSVIDVPPDFAGVPAVGFKAGTEAAAWEGSEDREKIALRRGDPVTEASRSSTAFAKTTQPTMGSVVDREALFARLDGLPGRSVAWIAGPPGSGKSTLAATYLKARRLQSVWYQIDADDADPASFFHFLRHAASKIPGARGRDLPAFSPRHGDDVPAFARAFFRQLFARAGTPFVLVLDNMESVASGSALPAALEAGFSQVPKGCCVIVTSRAEPPAALARLRAAGLMCHITGTDLNVSPEEIVAIAAARGQIVAPEAAGMLHDRTQGWVAGLVLMLEHSKFSGQGCRPAERRHSAGDLRLPCRRDLRPLRSGNPRIHAADRLPAADDGEGGRGAVR